MTRAEVVMQAIIGTLDEKRPAFLAFSGGRESVVLAHLCRDLPVALVWVNTGAMFPHMVQWIREFGAGWDFAELSSDQAGNWAAMGLPADILPIANAMPGGMHQEPRLQAWVSCCSALRAQPLAAALQSLGRASILIHGQRLEDKAPGLGLSGAQAILPVGSDVLAPLADWSDAEVGAYVDEHQLDLPPQYTELSDSLECWNCPAAFHGEKGAARLDYMATHHAERLQQVAPMVQLIAKAGRAALQRADAVLEAGKVSVARLVVVPQRTEGLGDCGIAAMATVIGLSYEETAGRLGYQIDARGWPVLPAGGGIANVELASALLGLGFSGSLITVADHPINEHQAAFTRSPRKAELKTILEGERAILMAMDWIDGQPTMHALPWLGSAAYDCREPTDRVSFDSLDIVAAMVVRPTMRFGERKPQ